MNPFHPRAWALPFVYTLFFSIPATGQLRTMSANEAAVAAASSADGCDIVTALALEGRESLFGVSDRHQQPRQSTILFVTEREPSSDPKTFFGTTRSSRGLSTYGRAVVDMPVFTGFGSAEVPKNLQIKIDTGTSEQFFRRFAGTALPFPILGPRQIFVYVHGFNNSFREEIWRGAKLVDDLSPWGTMIVYDWPAHGSVLGYLADRNSVDVSADLFSQFLSQLSTTAGNTKINLIAHSMGGYEVVRALSILSDRGQVPQLENVIFAAADVDVDYFDSKLSPIVKAGKINFLTIYSSSHDVALMASKDQNQYHPVGLLPFISRIKGSSTVDATNVSPGLTGHDYFVSSPDVERDIGYILSTSGSSPPAKPHLGVDNSIHRCLFPLK